MSIIGSVLRRKRAAADAPRNIKVTGHNGLGYVCEPADQFGPSFVLTELDLATNYGAQLEPVTSEEDAQRALTASAHAETLRGARRRSKPDGTYAEPDPDSPEGKFAAIAAEQAADDANSD